MPKPPRTQDDDFGGPLTNPKDIAGPSEWKKQLREDQMRDMQESLTKAATRAHTKDDDFGGPLTNPKDIRPLGKAR